MTVVVGLSVVVRQESQRVVFSEMLRVLAHVGLDAVPEGWNCLNILVQAQYEAVLLSVIGHKLEGIVFDVAEQLNAWLDTPVPLVLEHEGVLKEKPRLVTTHVPVTDRITVDDLTSSHVFTNGLGLVLVDPFGEGPVLLWNQPVSRLARGKSACDLFESVVELLVVQEYPIVVVLVVEAVLNLANRTRDFPHIGVARKGNECRIHTWTICFRSWEANLGV